MINCIKHKVEFKDGKCPECERAFEEVSYSFTIKNPVMIDIQQASEFEFLNNKIDQLNNKIKGLLNEYNYDEKSL